MSEEKHQVSRRSFLEKLAAGAALAATGGTIASIAPDVAEAATADQATAAMNAGAFGMVLPGDAQAATVPSVVVNPNILMIMVDQLRVPQLWLTSGQQSTLDTSIAPNIAFIRQHSVQFTEFYGAAQNCTPSRGTLLTGLYSPQTGLLATQTGSGQPDLDSRFPTFGWALQDIAGYEAGSIFWFGKWHVSDESSPSSVANYGFNSGGLTPLWPSTYGSPNGTANEGTNGVTPASIAIPLNKTPKSLACDSAIAGDFQRVWKTPPSSPWFAAVSFVNPHDMSDYTGFFPPNSNYSTWIPGESAAPTEQGVGQNPYSASDISDFLPYSPNYGTGLFPALPSGFNYESPAALSAKGIALQPWYLQEINDATANGGTPVIIGGAHPGQPTGTTNENDFIDYLNWYYYMLSQVDQYIGEVVATALPGYSKTGSGNPSSNTAVIFLSDHGDYAGSHCLRSKGGAVYDEVLRLPFYVMLPGQSGSLLRTQMCSMVDVFKLVVELALGNSNFTWPGSSVYKDQASRQSLFSFIYDNGDETRQSSAFSPPMAYILSTTDELLIDPLQSPSYPCTLQNHVVCLRTKSLDLPSNPQTAYTGGKYAVYSKWALGTAKIDITTPQQIEFYDYEDLGNRGEIGNNYSASSPNTMQTNMFSALGNGPLANPSNPTYTPGPPTGLIGSELRAALQGTTRDGSTALSVVTEAGLAAWASWAETKIQDANSRCTS